MAVALQLVAVAVFVVGAFLAWGLGGALVAAAFPLFGFGLELERHGKR